MSFGLCIIRDVFYISLITEIKRKRKRCRVANEFSPYEKKLGLNFVLSSVSTNISAVREEASIFQMLDHGNIVEMYGVIVGDEPALVLELCRG